MLARYAITILLNEYGQIGCYVWGLRLSLYMDTQSLVVVGGSFIKFFDYAQTIKEMYHEAQGATLKDRITRVV